MHFSIAVALACASCASAANYTTYIGDSFPYQVSAITTDANGNTYITGSRTITNGQNGLPLSDVFVSKLDPSGNISLIATFSGKGIDQANAIALDPSGNIYIAGATTSPDFPLHNPLQSATPGGTGFLVKMTADGTVIYSTRLGGTLASSALNAVAADSQGNAYVTGTTFSPDYQHTSGLPDPLVGLGPGSIQAAFFAKIDPAGDQIVYAGALSATQRECGCCSSCFLSTLSTGGAGIAVDTTGNAYIAGNTNGGGLPTTPNALLADGLGAFVAKVDAGGTGLAYLTYIGAVNYLPPGAGGFSEPGNSVSAIGVDADGNAYISGWTDDPNFPATAGAFQIQLDSSLRYPYVPPSDAFVAKLNPTGTAMVWATYLGGSQADAANTIAVDPSGNVWVSGTTNSADFPHTFAWPNGGEFLSELDPTGSKLLYSAILPSNVAAAGLAVDTSGIVHYAGATGLVSAVTLRSAPGQSSTPSIFGVANAAGGSLGGRFVPGELISIFGLNLGPTTPTSAAFDAQGFLPTTLGGVQVMIGGIAAPLLYVSDTQINAVTPVELTVGVSGLAVAGLPSLRTEVDVADPQVFRNPNGSAAAINEDGTANSDANPAKVGSIVSIWATGLGSFPGKDGQEATGANQYGVCEIVTNLPNVNAPTPYCGAAPGLVNGVYQINFQVPAGALGFALTVGGVTSDGFGISVQP